MSSVTKNDSYDTLSKAFVDLTSQWTTEIEFHGKIDSDLAQPKDLESLNKMQKDLTEKSQEVFGKYIGLSYAVSEKVKEEPSASLTSLKAALDSFFMIYAMTSKTTSLLARIERAKGDVSQVVVSKDENYSTTLAERVKYFT